MPWCGAGKACKRPGRFISSGGRHMFSGYELYEVFHPECCPGGMDGSVCDYGHPAGWEPEEGLQVGRVVRREGRAVSVFGPVETFVDDDGLVYVRSADVSAGTDSNEEVKVSTMVRQGDDWREPNGTVWSVVESGPDTTTLARWVRGEHEPEQARMPVATQVLVNGDGGWMRLAEHEAEEERSRLADLAAHARVERAKADTEVLRESILRPAGIALDDLDRLSPMIPSSSVGAGEPRLSAVGARGLFQVDGEDGPLSLGGVDAIEVANDLAAWRGQLKAAGMSARMLMLLRIAEAGMHHLDERSGPQFVAWRCDECGHLVTEPQAQKALRLGGALGAALGVRVVPSREDAAELSYVECISGVLAYEHGPMRHIVARVTADDPIGLG